uniref:hypothetical protein Ycf34 n=1 Tax=Lietzensia polymorpha TaxID=2962110 RepID=UPI00218227BD|nr:hypothetical protein Ycf34 [Lietzensia polymorpha]UVI61235.1 hypothetical protein Ycf34 [Lietzensia polymorpha]
MCICINCGFYNNCWIKQGIAKMPKNYINIALDLNVPNPNIVNIKQALSLKINLNNFIFRQKYEFDVIECEGFCEKPGNWILKKF